MPKSLDRAVEIDAARRAIQLQEPYDVRRETSWQYEDRLATAARDAVAEVHRHRVEEAPMTNHQCEYRERYGNQMDEGLRLVEENTALHARIDKALEIAKGNTGEVATRIELALTGADSWSWETRYGDQAQVHTDGTLDA